MQNDLPLVIDVLNLILNSLLVTLQKTIFNRGVWMSLVHTSEANIDTQSHYKNFPMQYTEMYTAVKNENFVGIFFISETCSKHRLWVHVRTAPHKEYPQSVFWYKNKKNM